MAQMKLLCEIYVKCLEGFSAAVFKSPRVM